MRGLKSIDIELVDHDYKTSVKLNAVGYEQLAYKVKQQILSLMLSCVKDKSLGHLTGFSRSESKTISYFCTAPDLTKMIVKKAVFDSDGKMGTLSAIVYKVVDNDNKSPRKDD